MRGKPIKQRLQEMGRTLNDLSTQVADTGAAPAAVVQTLIDEFYDLGDIVLTHELNIADLERAVFGLDQSSRPTMERASDPAFKALGDNPAERIVRQEGAVADELDAEAAEEEARHDAEAVIAEQEESRRPE